MGVETSQLEAWQLEIKGLYRSGSCPHASNLLHQFTPKALANEKISTSLSHIVPAYLKFTQILEKCDVKAAIVDAEEVTQCLEEYLKVLRTPGVSCFESVSDFLTSVIPEFFLRILHKLIHEHKYDLVATGQRHIPIELAFDLRQKELFLPRFQRVDIAIVRKMDFSVDGHSFPEFCVPIFAAEAKTYFDKNMISGVDFSITSLKTTFPGCLYFAIGEWTDFELSGQSFASTSIDEIYVLRKQRRAEYRKSGIPNLIDKKLISEILFRVNTAIATHDKVRPDLDSRIGSGALIEFE